MNLIEFELNQHDSKTLEVVKSTIWHFLGNNECAGQLRNT